MCICSSCLCYALMTYAQVLSAFSLISSSAQLFTAGKLIIEHVLLLCIIIIIETLYFADVIYLSVTWCKVQYDKQTL